MFIAVFFFTGFMFACSLITLLERKYDTAKHFVVWFLLGVGFISLELQHLVKETVGVGTLKSVILNGDASSIIVEVDGKEYSCKSSIIHQFNRLKVVRFTSGVTKTSYYCAENVD